MNNENEVLECLNILQNALDKYLKVPLTEYVNLFDCINTIKNYILKEQEPKHYLKWEDLDFTKDTKCQKATMNGKEYTLYYFVLNDTHNEVLIQNNEGSICSACNEQFFNDLHLEVVEE